MVDGKAEFRSPRSHEPTALDGKILSWFSSGGHDLTECSYRIDESLQTAEKTCCNVWSGPVPEGSHPHANKPHCKISVVEFTGNKNSFTLEGKPYIWNERVGGYLPGSMHPDWPIIFEAAFQSLPNLDDYLRTWKHHPDSCRFCKGICYSGVQANYLCELDGDKNSMLDDAASVTRE